MILSNSHSDNGPEFALKYAEICRNCLPMTSRHAPPPPQYAIYKSGCAIIPWQCAPDNSRFSHLPGPYWVLQKGLPRQKFDADQRWVRKIAWNLCSLLQILHLWLTFLPQLDELGKTVDRIVDDLLSGIRALDDSRIDTTSLAKVKMLYRTCVLLLAMLSTWYGTDRCVM